MEQEASNFLEKFVASLCVRGVTSIPFTGEEFQQGVCAMENVLHEHLNTVDFAKLSDMFIKVPVEETYQQIRTMFMNLNGHGISFSGVDNPMWSVMTIKMTPYRANKVLNDDSIINVDINLMNRIAEEFCEAAGVELWEEL
ncbi:MAG: hypothetical protein HDR02_13195 [Lachnospiraceae bacterium]|nr:hypothetical protein [Lachnospiraceae bacterium]